MSRAGATGDRTSFSSAADRKSFLDLLARSIEIYQVTLVAFVLMRNHLHDKRLMRRFHEVEDALIQ